MIVLKEILDYIRKSEVDFSFQGDDNERINGFSSLTNYKENTITWCKNMKLLPNGIENKCKFIVLHSDEIGNGAGDKFKNYIAVDNPKKVFFMIVEKFFAVEDFIPGIGQGTYISEKVVLGKNVKIGCNCTIDGDIKIGDGTRIFNNVVIINKADIGENCVIHSGVIIGHDDYAYTEDEEHNKSMIRHYGGVIVQDDVFIGAGCIINRGTIDDTVISKGSKIDAHCHVSHNVVLGEKSALISGTRLYGSVKTGENVYIASAIVKNQLIIGDNSTVGMGSVVLKSVADEDIVVGIPAKSIKRKDLER